MNATTKLHKMRTAVALEKLVGLKSPCKIPEVLIKELDKEDKLAHCSDPMERLLVLLLEVQFSVERSLILHTKKWLQTQKLHHTPMLR